MIRLAGVELTIDDPEGRLAAWVNQALSLGDLRDFARPTALVSQRKGPRTDYLPGVGLPVPNYSDPPPPRVGELYWPTGALRWARGYFLATTDQMEAVLEETDNLNLPVLLELVDQSADGNAIKTEMYLMPPRPLSAIVEGGQNLYLMPLVDARYWWQFIDVDELEVPPETPWSFLYETCEFPLQTLIVFDPISPTYFNPDPDAWSRPYENVALLLDAIAHSLGQRIVRQLDGLMYAMSWETAEEIYDENVLELTDDPALLPNAGGDFSLLNAAAANPEFLAVSFTKWREGAVDPGGNQWIEVNPLEFGEPFTADTAKVVFTSAFADFTSGDETPDNLSPEVQPLAFQIMTDYFGWQQFRYDASFPYLAEITFTGFDDFALWSFGSLIRAVPEVAPCEPRRGDDGDGGAIGGSGYVKEPEFTYKVSTRLQSQAPNFGVTEQLSQFPDKLVHPALTRFTLTQALAASDLTSDPPFIASAKAVHRVWDPIDQRYEDSTDTLVVREVLGTLSGNIGDHGWAEYKEDSKRWEVVQLNVTRPSFFSVIPTYAFNILSPETGSSYTVDFFSENGGEWTSNAFGDWAGLGNPVPTWCTGLPNPVPNTDDFGSVDVDGQHYLLCRRGGTYQLGFTFSFRVVGEQPSTDTGWTLQALVIGDNIVHEWPDSLPVGPYEDVVILSASVGPESQAGTKVSTDLNAVSGAKPLKGTATIGGILKSVTDPTETFDLTGLTIDLSQLQINAGCLEATSFLTRNDVYTLSANGLFSFAAGAILHLRFNLQTIAGFNSVELFIVPADVDRFYLVRVGDQSHAVAECYLPG